MARLESILVGQGGGGAKSHDCILQQRRKKTTASQYVPEAALAFQRYLESSASKF